MHTWVGLCYSNWKQCIWEPLAGSWIVAVPPPQLSVSPVLWGSGASRAFTVTLSCPAPASTRSTEKKGLGVIHRCDKQNLQTNTNNHFKTYQNTLEENCKRNSQVTSLQVNFIPHNSRCRLLHCSLKQSKWLSGTTQSFLFPFGSPAHRGVPKHVFRKHGISIYYHRGMVSSHRYSSI